jgi:hypothetical protein
MSDLHARPRQLDSFLNEHRDLMHRVSHLRGWWNEVAELGMPRFGELASRLVELRDILADHFRREEQGGYMTPALSAAPQLARQVSELQSQHEVLLERIDDLVSRLRCCDPAFPGWQVAKEEFEEILSDLREHEVAENMLMQSAFEQDVGVAD